MFNKIVIKNGAIYIGFEVLNKALPFILVPVLTRIQANVMDIAHSIENLRYNRG